MLILGYISSVTPINTFCFIENRNVIASMKPSINHVMFQATFETPGGGGVTLVEKKTRVFFIFKYRYHLVKFSKIKHCAMQISRQASRFSLEMAYLTKITRNISIKP